MNLDSQPDPVCRRFSIVAWLLAGSSLAAVVGYLAWTVFSGSFDAAQAQWHPFLASRVIVRQMTGAAPPWEWNVPLWSMAVTAAWLFGVWSCGWGLVRCQLLSNMPISARAILAFAVGFTIFGWLQAVVALAGGARLSLIPIFAGAGVLLLMRSRGTQNEVRQLRRAAQWQWGQLSQTGRTLVLICAAGILLMLVPALTPPIQSDGVRYHLGGPQEFLKAGNYDYLPLNAYSNMPFLVEMHFMAALGLGAPEATQLIHMILALMTALGIYAVTRALTLAGNGCSVQSTAAVSRATWLIAPVLYISAPMSAILATWPFTDHGISLMLVVSLLAAITCLRRESIVWHWVIFGVCLGGLIGTKYTMAPVALVMFMACLVMARKPDALAAKSRRFLTMTRFVAGGAAATLFGGVWFTRNWLLIGNPVYPFATKLFPGGEWGPANDAFLTARAGAKGFGKDLDDLLMVPWNGTFRWIAFETHNPGALILLSLFIVAAGMFIYGSSQVRREVMFICITAATAFGVWFFSYHSNRLLLPVIAVALTLVPAHIFSARRGATKLMCAGAILFALTGFGWAVQWSWVATSLSPPPLPYLLGQQDASAYRYKSLTYARAFDYLNQRVQENEKVLLVGEHRIFGAQFDAIWSDWFDTPALVQILRENDIASTDELLQYLREKNTTWIMINERELEPQLEQHFRPWFTTEEWKIFEELRQHSGDGVDIIKMPPGVTIIRLEPTP